MNLLKEFKSREICQKISEEISYISKQPVVIMEVCGGHTMAIYRYGIKELLPPTIKLVSGPGCPVCVSDISFIDKAIALSKEPDVIITTYGDLIRVPGSYSSLEKEKANGANVKIVWSALDAVKIAAENNNKKVVFLGIGFETTIPGSAMAILEAKKLGIKNFFVLSAHKIMPPAMSALIDEGIKIDAYLCPGHVSVITGSKIYEPISEKYRKPCVISGFEPVDILKSILMIVKQIEEHRAEVEIEYTRAVKREGNIKAQKLISEVFITRDDKWRGIGIIPLSGMKPNKSYYLYDAEEMLPLQCETTNEKKGCICGEILKGLKQPSECKLFNTVCKPENPVGACMVSNEGACAAFYRYGDYEK